MKTDLEIRPIWHWTAERVQAHILVAFLTYCLWVCLGKKAQAMAPSLSPRQILDQLAHRLGGSLV